MEDSFSGQSALEGTTRYDGRGPPSAVLSALCSTVTEDGSAVRIVRPIGANKKLRTGVEWCRVSYSGSRFFGKGYTSVAGGDEMGFGARSMPAGSPAEAGKWPMPALPHQRQRGPVRAALNELIHAGPRTRTKNAVQNGPTDVGSRGLGHVGFQDLRAKFLAVNGQFRKLGIFKSPLEGSDYLLDRITTFTGKI